MLFKRRGQSDGLKPVSVIWVTNMAAPYRVPLWKSLQTKVLLEVALLESRFSLAADVFANRGSDWILDEKDTISIREVPTWKLRRGEGRYYFPKQIRSLILPRNHDVVVFGGWESPIYWLLLLVAKLYGRGCVGFYESTIATNRHRRGPIAWMRQRYFRAMDSIVVPGPAALDAVLALGVPAHKIFQGFNAVDVNAFQAASPGDSDNAVEGHAFLFVGQLISRKRVDAIVDSYDSISAPLDSLTIVGSGDQTEMLKNRTAANRNIRIIPYVANESMPSIMSKHNTLVLASSEEVWGLVVNEALATGLHVVVSSNCGVVPSIKDMAGVYVAQENLGDLAAMMAKSRCSWAGPIPNPEILKYTPEEFAGVFWKAILRSAQRDQIAGGAATASV